MVNELIYSILLLENKTNFNWSQNNTFDMISGIFVLESYLYNKNRNLPQFTSHPFLFIYTKFEFHIDNLYDYVLYTTNKIPLFKIYQKCRTKILKILL